MKYQIRFLLCACVLFMMAGGYAQAATYNISYSGTFTSIFDTDGNAGGSFSPGTGINIGDTFNGTFILNTGSTAIGDSSSTPPIYTSYNFVGAQTPNLTLNGTETVSLKPKAGLAVVDNVNTALLPTYYAGGVRDSGFDPLPGSADFLLFYTDEQGFDATTNTGYEIILAMFDPNGTAFSGTGIPDPLSPLSNSFLIYLETINGTTQAAGFGPISNPTISAVPIPAAAWLFGSGLLGLIGFARRKKV